MQLKHVVFVLYFLTLTAVMGLAGCASTQIQDTAWPEPRPLGRELGTYRPPLEPAESVPASVDNGNPTAVVTLPRALSLALMKNPELAAFSWEVRAGEARTLQAGLSPNPEIGVEIEEFAGSGDRQGVDAATSTVQHSNQYRRAWGKRRLMKGRCVMRTRAERTMALLGLCVFAAALLGGCATNRASLRDAGTVTVEILHIKETRAGISSTNVYQDGNELTVTGIAGKQGHLFSPYDVHIDVAVIAPDGETVRLRTAKYHHFRSRRRSSSFTLRFPLIAEKGTAVRLVLHRADGADSKQLHAAAIEMLERNGKTARP